MNSVIKMLQSALVVLQLAKTTLEMLDTNTTGWDDDFVRFLDKMIDEIKKFLQTHPPAPDTVARGYTATLAFCNLKLQSANVIRESNLPKAERIAQLMVLLADLKDDNQVYPAKKGKDADVLNATKEKMESYIQQEGE